ncbi:MAG: hypothetical protein WCR63_00520 [Bacilli bacterium]
MIDKENKFVDIYPLKKSHRILTWLGDFFINFICTILLFNIAVFPITKAIVGYDQINANIASYQDDMIKVLYENKVLFYEGNELDYFDDNLVTTCEKFVAYHVKEQIEEENCFYNYYYGIRNDGEALVDLYSSDSGSTFFDLETLDENGVPTLKDEYVTEFTPLYIEGDALSTNAETDYESFTSLFLKYYNVMLQDITSNDLTYGELSYVQLSNQVDALSSQLDNYIVTGALVSYLLSIVILYILIPIFGIKKQTITERVMKVSKVGQDNLRILPRVEVILQSFYAMFSNLTLIVICVVPTIDIAYAFSLNLLVFLSFFGLIYNIVGLFFIWLNQYNKSLTDMLTKVIYLEDFDLSKVLRTKGNKF